MSDLNYEELNDKEKEVYDNAYKRGWSSSARAAKDVENLKDYIELNPEKLFWKYKLIFKTAYEKGMSDYQAYIASQSDI